MGNSEIPVASGLLEGLPHNEAVLGTARCPGGQLAHTRPHRGLQILSPATWLEQDSGPGSHFGHTKISLSALSALSP